jgi:thiamine biosynthesis protein ThiI
MPVFRPLIGMDKVEVVDIARKIDTFETSILPYEDCCTVFVAKHPQTKPKLDKIMLSESKVDFEPLIKTAVETTEVIVVRP